MKKKKIGLVLGTVLLLVGVSNCKLWGPELFDINQINFDYEENFSNITEIRLWIYNNIVYEEDYIDYWQTPEETYNKRVGDCEDFEILFMYFLKNELGLDSNLIIVKTENNIDHAIVEVEGENNYHSSTWTATIPKDYYKIKVIYNYDKTMFFAEVWKTDKWTDYMKYSYN